MHVGGQTSRVRAALVAGTSALLAASVLAVPSRAATSHDRAEPVARPEVDRILRDSRIVESSGLARSTFPRPVLWTHNDSGDSARVFAVGQDGRTRAVLSLDGVHATDWEDMASGPGHTLWAGDIGDNGWSRELITVHRFREPRALESGLVRAISYDFRYEDGPRDAEALLVHPRTGRLFIVSKAGDGAAVYRAPRRLSTSSTNTLRRVAKAPDTVTGGSFAPDGESFVLVSYTHAYVYSRLGRPPVSVSQKVNHDQQGESAEIGRAGRRLLLGQEGGDSPVHALPYRAS